MLRENLQALAGRTIRCILFDLGETLWTRKEKEILQEKEQEANLRAVTFLQDNIDTSTLPVTDPKLLGGLLRITVDKQTHMMGQLRPGHEPDFALATAEALRQLGLPDVDLDMAAEIFERLRVRSFGSRHPFDDTFSTLDALKERGFLLGIVSNRQYGGEIFLEDLRQMGLLDYFETDHIAISADLRIRKPNPRIFLHTLNALQVPPEEAAMVGDSLRADVVGAKSLHMFAIWKPKRRLRTKALKALSPGSNTLSDEYLLAYARMQEEKRSHSLPEDVKPDLIIEHLSELLDVFPKAGLQ